MTDGEAVLFPEFEDALMGVLRQAGREPVALYCYERCVKLLMEEGLDAEEAIEYMEFNVVGAYIGPYTPAFSCGSSQLLFDKTEHNVKPECLN